jgi:lipopolysaccharide export system permease protein
LRPFVFDRLDRYAVRLFAGPFFMALAAMLLATMLERLLRLFDLSASTGAPILSVLWMGADLVPHYLGLALPVAFTAAIFIAAARMCDDSELDAMLTAGRSIARIVAPYFVLAVLLSLFNLYLFGVLQPMARYQYHVGMDKALQTNWDAKLEENTFIDVGHGTSFSADTVESDGRRLRGVFLERRGPDFEEVTTAVRGKLEPTPDGTGLLLRLDDGIKVRESTDGKVSTTRFKDGYITELTPIHAAFRDRGASASEKTLPELSLELCKTCDVSAAAAFHARLARTLVPLLLPLLALPLGMASKRGRRTPGVIFAALSLLLLNHALQFGASLAESGRVPAVPAVWAPFLLFGALSVWIFSRSLAWPGDNPVSRAVLALEGLLDRVRPRRRAKVSA